MFGEFDAYETADARLYDLDFNITLDKTFKQFLTRYIVTITPLQLRKQ